MAEAVAKKPRASKPKAEKEVTEAPVKVTQEAPKTAKKAPKSGLPAGRQGFAVISTGGKQYVVKPGQKLKIEKLLGDHKEGDVVVFKDVLLKGDDNGMTLGTPKIAGASVEATITKIARHPKVTVIHYKQKSRYFKKYGHRQPFFEVQIDSIK